jgi:hypothetical protein
MAETEQLECAGQHLSLADMLDKKRKFNIQGCPKRKCALCNSMASATDDSLTNRPKSQK